MVLFRSLNASDVSNPDDLKQKTIQFFSRGGASAAPAAYAGGHGLSDSRGARMMDESTVEGQLLCWLEEEGYRANTSLSVAGSAAVVEDWVDDRRICVCIDGTGGSSLAEWAAAVKEERGLARTGWLFVRLWVAHPPWTCLARRPVWWPFVSCSRADKLTRYVCAAHQLVSRPAGVRGSAQSRLRICRRPPSRLHFRHPHPRRRIQFDRRKGV